MLHALPLEMIELTLERCHFIDILHTSETCRKLLDLVSNSAKLQLHIELEASGFELCEGASRDGHRPAELLERLKSVRNKWLYLDIPDPGYLEFPEPLRDMSEYVPRLGYIPFRSIGNQPPSTIFHGFDLATNQMRTLEPGVAFVKASVYASKDLLVLISPVLDTKS
ncbi:hypothetical protein BDV93DRAFT_115679 [Ceratobasidium sp. AG-I]|nr:hypothetical protein BDV93DRAFT_115679 [Ceratobasidium sp. AG-I]